MESVKNIRNDALVKAYQTMHENNTKENQQAVTRQMVRATFLLPVTPVKKKPVSYTHLPRSFVQERIFKRPTSPVRSTWVPQQAHTSTPGMVTIRTAPSSSFLLR